MKSDRLWELIEKKDLRGLFQAIEDEAICDHDPGWYEPVVEWGEPKVRCRCGMVLTTEEYRNMYGSTYESI